MGKLRHFLEYIELLFIWLHILIVLTETKY